MLQGGRPVYSRAAKDVINDDGSVDDTNRRGSDGEIGYDDKVGRWTL